MAKAITVTVTLDGPSTEREFERFRKELRDLEPIKRFQAVVTHHRQPKAKATPRKKTNNG